MFLILIWSNSLVKKLEKYKEKIKITHNSLSRDTFNILVYILPHPFQCICVNIYKIDIMLYIVLVLFFFYLMFYFRYFLTTLNLPLNKFSVLAFVSYLFISFVHFSVGMLMYFILICKNTLYSKAIIFCLSHLFQLFSLSF